MAQDKVAGQTARPEFGKDYDVGWVGFVHGTSLLSATIAYLTRWDRSGDAGVTHSFLLTGPGECVEANLPVGVIVSSLAEAYFDREGVVLFRRPRGLTPDVAGRLVERAKAQVGARFDFAGMGGEALGGTFLGHLLNSLFAGQPRELMAGLLHEKGRWVCSDLVLYCFREELEYRDKGALARPVGTVSPQALFEDDEALRATPEPASPEGGRVVAGTRPASTEGRSVQRIVSDWEAAPGS